MSFPSVSLTITVLVLLTVLVFHFDPLVLVAEWRDSRAKAAPEDVCRDVRSLVLWIFEDSIASGPSSSSSSGILKLPPGNLSGKREASQGACGV